MDNVVETGVRPERKAEKKKTSGGPRKKKEHAVKIGVHEPERDTHEGGASEDAKVEKGHEERARDDEAGEEAAEEYSREDTSGGGGEPSGMNDEHEIVKMWKSIDEELEGKAATHNLSAINVKSILHQLIKYPDVIPTIMGLKGNEEIPSVRLTRSKAAKNRPKPENTIMGIEYPDEEEEDDVEYAPDSDESDDSDDAGDETRTTFHTVAESPAGERVCPSSQSSEATDDEFLRTPPMMTPTSTYLTRSRCILNAVEPMDFGIFDDIDTSFEPLPESYFDNKPLSPLYRGFVHSVFPGSSSTPVPLDLDEEEDRDDPDYTVRLEDLIMDEREEFAPPIPQQEVKELLLDLIPSETLSTLSNVADLAKAEGTRKRKRRSSGEKKKRKEEEEGIVIDRISCPLLPHGRPVTFTQQERDTLRRQLEQHVQLLTQQFVSVYYERALSNELEQTDIMLSDLHKTMLSSPKGSFFDIANVDYAVVTCAKVAATPPYSDEQNVYVEKNSEDVHILKAPRRETCNVLSASGALLYPELVPKYRLFSGIPQFGWTDAENALLAIGMYQFRDLPHARPGRTGKYPMIRECLLPSKDLSQIRSRVKNIKTAKQVVNKQLLEISRGVSRPKTEQYTRLCPGMTMNQWKVQHLPSWHSRRKASLTYGRELTLRKLNEEQNRQPSDRISKTLPSEEEQANPVISRRFPRRTSITSDTAVEQVKAFDLPFKQPKRVESAPPAIEQINPIDLLPAPVDHSLRVSKVIEEVDRDPELDQENIPINHVNQEIQITSIDQAERNSEEELDPVNLSDSDEEIDPGRPSDLILTAEPEVEMDGVEDTEQTSDEVQEEEEEMSDDGEVDDDESSPVAITAIVVEDKSSEEEKNGQTATRNTSIGKGVIPTVSRLAPRKKMPSPPLPPPAKPALDFTQLLAEMDPSPIKRRPLAEADRIPTALELFGSPSRSCSSLAADRPRTPGVRSPSPDSLAPFDLRSPPRYADERSLHVRTPSGIPSPLSSLSKMGQGYTLPPRKKGRRLFEEELVESETTEDADMTKENESVLGTVEEETLLESAVEEEEEGMEDEDERRGWIWGLDYGIRGNDSERCSDGRRRKLTREQKERVGIDTLFDPSLRNEMMLRMAWKVAEDIPRRMNIHEKELREVRRILGEDGDQQQQFSQLSSLLGSSHRDVLSLLSLFVDDSVLPADLVTCPIRQGFVAAVDIIIAIEIYVRRTRHKTNIRNVFKTLLDIAREYPNDVTRCNEELYRLIGHDRPLWEYVRRFIGSLPYNENVCSWQFEYVDLRDGENPPPEFECIDDVDAVLGPAPTRREYLSKGERPASCWVHDGQLFLVDQAGKMSAVDAKCVDRKRGDGVPVTEKRKKTPIKKTTATPKKKKITSKNKNKGNKTVRASSPSAPFDPSIHLPSTLQEPSSNHEIGDLPDDILEATRSMAAPSSTAPKWTREEDGLLLQLYNDSEGNIRSAVRSALDSLGESFSKQEVKERLHYLLSFFDNE